MLNNHTQQSAFKNGPPVRQPSKKKHDIMTFYRRFKGEEGFTLMEVIVSVAAIAIVSSFILQMFLISSFVNQTAQNLDIGQAKAISAIEVVKSQTNPFYFIKEPEYSHAISINGDNFLMIYQCFNENWEEIIINTEIDNLSTQTIFNEYSDVKFILVAQAFQSDMISSTLKETKPLLLKTTFSSAGESDSAELIGETYVIDATITMRRNVTEMRELVKLSSKKYYVYVK